MEVELSSDESVDGLDDLDIESLSDAESYASGDVDISESESESE